MSAQYQIVSHQVNDGFAEGYFKIHQILNLANYAIVYEAAVQPSLTSVTPHR